MGRFKLGLVRVMTDSTACIPPDLAKKYNIKIIPTAHIIINGKSYIENVTISAKEAYEALRKEPDNFVTSAITPIHILEAYRELAKETQEIIFITISSCLSAFQKSATQAAVIFKEESPTTYIKIIDSKGVAGGEGLLALAAAKAAEKGLNISQIGAIIEKLQKETKTLMMLDTLRYIYRTGRMSKLSARIASMLNIRPINWVTEAGTVEMAARVRNREDGIKRIVELIKEKAPDDYLIFMLSHGDAPDFIGAVAEALKKNFKVRDIIIGDYSPVMGYGGGPGAICIGFHPDIKLF
jgi:DegV family protein with EDD domain